MTNPTIMADADREQIAAGYLDIPGLGELAAPSSLLSSRWSRDNVVTAHPSRLYDGRVLEHIDADALEALVQELFARRGPFEVGAGRLGVFTWDIACRDQNGSFVLQVPVALDEPGRGGRAKRDVPRQNVENARYFAARGLARFVVEPEDLVTLGAAVPAAIFRSLPQQRPVTFGAGALRVRRDDGFLVALGTRGTAELLVELIAALVYHYEPDVAGGTAVTDVFVNDGDFAVRRRNDGSFDVRLTAVRRRESGIGAELLLLYLVQLMAYEDFSVDGGLTGLPSLISNPSLAFAGLTRGLAYRQRDLGGTEADAEGEARRWIEGFGHSELGRAYRPWVERFLAGRLPPAFGDDPREHWWRLYPLERNQRLLELRGRLEARSADSARTLRGFLDRLSRELGRVPDENPALYRLNDLDGAGAVCVLAEAGVAAEAVDEVAADMFAVWPHRQLDQLIASVPRARGLKRLKSRLSFGTLLAAAEEGTLAALGAPPKAGPRRPLANHELFGALSLAPALVAEAVRTFPTFETYMDTALHDPKWGYYGHGVVIGKAGHFDTHPEELSPDYGRWLAGLAFEAWRDLIAHGELAELEPFAVIEFGAGNGRLARDILDAIARAADDPARADRGAWKTFGASVEYRIYEMSEALRARQRELVGERAVIAPGDARAPGATLRRDFPNGVKGFVVTNEVPDAFGVHKVVFAADGRAFAALVVPRVEPELADLLDTETARRVNAADAAVRATFGFAGHAGERYLDGVTFGAVLEVVWGLAPEERDAALGHVWFEEAYVPVSALPELAAHLVAGAHEYATALAAEDSGVVQYVNVHAGGFIRELGAALRAGFVVTIDYGDTTWGLIQGARRGEFPFRVYGEQRENVPRPNDPYTAPGTQDLTADVNFTELTSAGEEVGLTLVHFGPERDIAGDELPALVRDAAPTPGVAKFLGHPGFKVLVLGKRPSAAFTTPFTTSLALRGREQEVPKLQREKIPRIRGAITGLVSRGIADAGKF
jgi:SAM-dependent MidA family methyltransferase